MADVFTPDKQDAKASKAAETLNFDVNKNLVKMQNVK